MTAIVTRARSRPLASNNQFLHDERDFRGCGFISARLEESRKSGSVRDWGEIPTGNSTLPTSILTDLFVNW